MTFPQSTATTLTAGSPFLIENPQGAAPILLLGDHAGRAIPPALGDLGLGAADLDRHIAWDIGVAGLGKLLSTALDAAFIHQLYSRLVIDCNRAEGQAGLIAETSDNTIIPGNAGLNVAARQARIGEIYWPYHHRIAAELRARKDRGERTALVSLHSFTPALAGGAPRPWRMGVLHRNDSELARKILAALRKTHGEAVIGDNQPYAMDGIDFTIPHHADAHGLDYVELEVRQDLIADEAGQAELAALLAPVLRGAVRS